MTCHKLGVVLYRHVCIYNFVSELDAEFAIGYNVLKCVSSLNPSSKHFLCPETINELVKLYPRSGINEFILNNQHVFGKILFTIIG